MKTFVATKVLVSWGSGMIVLKAQSRKKAVERILNEFSVHDFFVDCGFKEDCHNEYCLKHRLRELKDDELLYVWGSD